MSKLDPFIIEEAHHRTRQWLDKVAATREEADELECAASVMFLGAEKGRAERMKVSSPPERKALVTNELARVFNDYRCKE